MIEKIKNNARSKLFLGSALLISAILGPAVSYNSIYLFHFVLCFVVFRTLINKETRKQLVAVAKRPNNLLLGFAWLWLFTSLLWAENKAYGVLSMIQLSIGLSLVLLLQVFIQNQRDFNFYKRKILPPILILILVISFLEIHTGFRWPISLLSFNNHWSGREILIEGLLQKELVPNYLLSSPTVFFWNPNNLAVALCLFFPFLLEKRWINYFLFSLLVLVIIHTGSRLTMISLMIGLSAAVLLNRNNFRFLALYSCILLLPILFFSETTLAYKCNEIVYKISGKNVLNRDSQSYTEHLKLSENDNSHQIRSQLYKQGLDDLKETKLLGVGAGNAEWHNEKRKMNTQDVTAVHFYWLELVINGGLVIAIIFILYFIRIYKHLWKKRESPLSQSFILSLFVFSMAIISLSSAHYFLPYYAFLGVLSAVIEILNTHEKSSPIR